MVQILFISIIFLHCIVFTNANSRYIIPLVILLIPMGVYFVLECSAHFFKGVIKGKLKHAVLISYGLFLFILVFYLAKITTDTLHRRQVTFDDQKNYEWIIDHSVRNDHVMSSSPHRCNFFTGLPSVIMPENLNQEWFEKFIQKYRIRYVHVEGIHAHRYVNNKFFKNNFFKDGSIKLKSHFLELRTVTDGYGEGDHKGRVWVYEVRKLL